MAKNRFGDEVTQSTVNRFGDSVEFDLGDSPATAVADTPSRMIDASADDLNAMVDADEKAGAFNIHGSADELNAMVEADDAKPNRFAKLHTLYAAFQESGKTPETRAAYEAERSRLQAEYESENRNFITKSFAVRGLETAAKSIKSGTTQIVAEAGAAAASAIGKNELRDSLRGVSKRINEQTANEQFIQSELDKDGLMGATITGWTRQAVAAISEAALAGGGRSGLTNLAAYYGAKSTAESHAQGKSFSESALHGLIEGSFTLAGGKLLGAGTGVLAGVGKKTTETTADKIAAYLAQKTSGKISKLLAKIAGASSGEVLEEVGTEAAHYLTEVGFGKDFNVKEFTNRLINAAGPAAIAGGGAKAVHGAINGFGNDVAKLRADLKKAPNDPKTIEAAEKTITDPPADAEPAPTATEATPSTPEPATTTTPPPAETVTPPEPTGPTTSARRVDVDADRADMGLDEIDTPETRTWAAALDTAKQNGTPNRALDLANEIIATPRTLSDVETAGVVVKAAELKKQHGELLRQLNAATDPVDVKLRAAEINRVQQDFDTISQALRTSGTEKGRALAAQKLTINQDFDLVSTLSRAKASKGADLTDAEKGKLSDSVKKFERAQQSVDANDKKEKHREVERIRGAIKSIRRTVGLDPTNEKTDVPALSDTDRKDLADLDTALKEAEAKLGTVDSLDARGKVHNRPSEVEVSELDDKIAKVQAAIKAKRPTTQTDSAAVEQKRIDALAKKLDDARKAVADLKAGKPYTKPVPNRRADVASEERTRLQFELDKARKEINSLVHKLRPKSMWGHSQEPFHFMRAMMTSWDLSGYLRQGGHVVASHPIMASKAFLPMLRAARSDLGAYKVNQEILNRPNAPLYERAGLFLHRDDTDITHREESFMSKFAEEKVPGIKASERAYTTVLNRMRADLFDTMSATLAKNGEPTLAESRAIANYVNVATGRGGLGKADRAMTGLGVLFFAPRYTLSRFQYLAGQPMWGANAREGGARVQKAIAKEYARYLIGMGAVYATAAAVWGDDEKFSLTFDPRSADFGKIKLGNTRLDPLSGLSQTTRFIAQMVSGQTINSRGQVKDLRGPKAQFGSNAADTVFRFARTKASPFAGTALDLVAGENVVGEPMNLNTVEGVANLGLRVTPLSWKDTYDALREQGIPRGTAMGLLNVLGVGVQTYDSRPKK